MLIAGWRSGEDEVRVRMRMRMGIGGEDGDRGERGIGD